MQRKSPTTNCKPIYWTEEEVLDTRDFGVPQGMFGDPIYSDGTLRKFRRHSSV